MHCWIGRIMQFHTQHISKCETARYCQNGWRISIDYSKKKAAENAHYIMLQQLDVTTAMLTLQT